MPRLFPARATKRRDRAVVLTGATAGTYSGTAGRGAPRVGRGSAAASAGCARPAATGADRLAQQ